MPNLPAIAGATLIAGLTGGFFLGRTVSFDRSPPDLGHAEYREEIASLRQQLAESERAREDLENRLPEGGMRAPVPSPHTGTMPGGIPAGMGGQGSMLQPPRFEPAENPRPVAEVLAAIHAAVAAGDWDLLTSLEPEVAAHGSTVAADLVSLLQSAESLAAMQTLAQMLAATGDRAALPVLHDLLRREGNSEVRTSVIRALGAIPDDSSVALLAAEFNRESGSAMPPSVAASSLGAIGTPAALRALQREMQEGDNAMVRMFGLNALADRRDRSLAGFFLTQVTRTDASSEYRTAAIRALGETGNRDYVSQLEVIALSPDSTRGMQEAAKLAINQLLGRQVFPIR